MQLLPGATNEIIFSDNLVKALLWKDCNYLKYVFAQAFTRLLNNGENIKLA